MCCGSRRAAWRAAAPAPVSSRRSEAPPPSPARTPPAASPGATPGAFPTAPLRYDGTAEVQVVGPVSGRAYRFSGEDPLQAVDARDAAIFLRYAAFQPA